MVFSHPKSVQLLARDVFADTATLCTDLLPSLIISKIDTIIARDVPNLEWCPSSAPANPPPPSLSPVSGAASAASASAAADPMGGGALEYAREYVQDVVSYLQSTFVVMMFLNERDTRAVHYLSCKHISQTLMVRPVCGGSVVACVLICAF